MISYLSRIALAVAVLLAAGCNSAARVYVNHKQLVNFYAYSLDPNSVGTNDGNGMFTMYKVTTISNTGSEAVTFNFNVSKVSTVAPDQMSNETPTLNDTLLGSLNLATATIPAGQTATINRCFIKYALTSASPLTLATLRLPIVYAASTNQPVTTNNIGQNAAVQQIGTAFPAVLQQFCKDE